MRWPWNWGKKKDVAKPPLPKDRLAPMLDSKILNNLRAESVEALIMALPPVYPIHTVDQLLSLTPEDCKGQFRDIFDKGQSRVATKTVKNANRLRGKSKNQQERQTRTKLLNKPHEITNPETTTELLTAVNQLEVQGQEKCSQKASSVAVVLNPGQIETRNASSNTDDFLTLDSINEAYKMAFNLKESLAEDVANNNIIETIEEESVMTSMSQCKEVTYSTPDYGVDDQQLDTNVVVENARTPGIDVQDNHCPVIVDKTGQFPEQRLPRRVHFQQQPEVDSEPVTEVAGGPDLYIDRGSTINLTCTVKFSPEPPHYIIWNHNNAIISYNSPRGGVSVLTEKGETTTSYLLIQQAKPTDSGKYSCNPSNSVGHSINVHVLNGELPAAMQTGGQMPQQIPLSFCLLSTVILLLM